MSKKDGWFQTLAGKEFNLFHPQVNDYDIDEIAHALAIQNRFNGHTLHPYSVAQHSVLVSVLLEEWGQSIAIQCAGLMHDTAEAYIGDLISPLKRGMEKFQIVEMQIMDAISNHFFLPHPMPQIVKKADMVMLMVERRDLLAPPPKPWFEDEDKIELPVWTIGSEMHWRDAKNLFLERFAELFGGRS